MFCSDTWRISRVMPNSLLQYYTGGQIKFSSILSACPFISLVRVMTGHQTMADASGCGHGQTKMELQTILLQWMYQWLYQSINNTGPQLILNLTESTSHEPIFSFKKKFYGWQIYIYCIRTIVMVIQIRTKRNTLQKLPIFYP